MVPPAPPNPVGTRRAQQKAHTRELILEAAKEMFETLGYEKATIRGIAKFAGVGVGTVMSHFPDKASLLSSALVADWRRTEELVKATMPLEADYREQLLHAAKLFFQYYAQRPSLSRNLLKEALFSLEVQGPELQAMDQESRDISVQILRAAQQRGEIREDVDCDVLHQALFGQYCYVCMIGLSQPKPDPDQMLAMLESLTDLIARGARPGPPGDATKTP